MSSHNTSPVSLKLQSKGTEIIQVIPEFHHIDPRIVTQFFSTEPFNSESQRKDSNVLFYINYTDLQGMRLTYLNPDKDPTIDDNRREHLVFYRKRLRSGNEIKYVQPQGSPRFAFLGGLVAFKDMIDYSRPYIIAEGEKKAFLLCSKGFPAIGVLGINGFYRNGNDLNKHIINETFRDLGLIDLIEKHKPGLILLQDSDALEGDNDRKARFYSSVKVFYELFKPMKIPLKYCMGKPEIEGKGIDDAFYKNPDIEFEDLVSTFILTSDKNIKEIHELFFPVVKPMRPAEIAHELSQSENFVSGEGALFEYNKGYWKLIQNQGSLENKILEMLGNNADKHKIKDALYLLAVKTFQQEMNLGAKEGKITLINGVLDYQSGKLLEHSASYYNTYKFNVEYAESATCPNWLRFLDDIFKEDEDKEQKILFLQCYFGLCLTTDTTFQKAVLLAGDGANGKGVLLHVISSILEPAQTCLSIQEIGHPNSAQKLIGKTFCYNPDLPKTHFNEAVFKAAVAGEKIPMKILYKDAFDYPVFAKFCFAANSLPLTNDLSHAYFRRWVIIEFNQCFTGREDYNLKSKLMNEMSGIFNWILAGLKHIRTAGGLPIPPSSNKAVNAYLSDFSSVESFILDTGIKSKDPDTKELLKEVYSSYTKYCLESGFNRPLTRNKFHKEFATRAKVKIFPGAGNQKYFWGVKLGM